MSKRRAEAVAMMNAESNKFRLRAERAEAAIQRVRGIPEKESDVGYPNDWHIGWNACRESVLDALEERGRDNDVLH